MIAPSILDSSDSLLPQTTALSGQFAVCYSANWFFKVHQSWTQSQIHLDLLRPSEQIHWSRRFHWNELILPWNSAFFNAGVSGPLEWKCNCRVSEADRTVNTCMRAAGRAGRAGWVSAHHMVRLVCLLSAVIETSGLYRLALQSPGEPAALSYTHYYLPEECHPSQMEKLQFEEECRKTCK